MATRHHLVPQFYLRNFADSSGRLTLVSRDDPSRAHRTSVRKAAAETGFYRIEPEDLEREEDRATFDPESVEAGLSGLETAMAPVIRKLAEGRWDTFGQEDWYRLIQFTAVQTVRGHRWRDDFAALATQAARIHVLEHLDERQVRARLAEQGEPSSPADVAFFIEGLTTTRFPRLVPPQAVLVQESLKMALGNPETEELGLGQFLATKRLELIPTERTAVLTGDEPVCWWSPGSAPIGYATAQVVWLPISPRLIVQFREPDFDLGRHGFPGSGSHENGDELANEVNRLVAAQAERWIIHHPEDKPLAHVVLPPREYWGDELVATREKDGTRRELYLHRRLRRKSRLTDPWPKGSQKPGSKQ